MVGPAAEELAKTGAVSVTAACGGVRGKLSLGQGRDTAGHWQWAGPGRLVAVTWQARPGGEAPGALRLGWTRSDSSLQLACPAGHVVCFMCFPESLSGFLVCS